MYMFHLGDDIPNIDYYHCKFLSKIKTCQVTGCWIWTNAKDKRGYGKITLSPSVESGLVFDTKNKKKSIKAHRLSYSIFKGPLTPGLMIDHICINKSCVNPDHLREVTARVNANENVLRHLKKES